MNIKGTKSEKNIKNALMGESLARNKYTFYAIQAQKEGHSDIAELYERMAKNESMHAKIWFTILNDGMMPTKANLMESAQGENGEWREMYPEFAKMAREEGLDELADMFLKVAEIEKDHERTFMQALVKLAGADSDVKAKALEKEKEEVSYKEVKAHRCMFCGAKFENRPDVCPVCGAIGAFEASTMQVKR